MHAPDLFDSQALTLHRARRIDPAMYLHDLVADDLHDRLSIVNREFTEAVLITGFPEYWNQKARNLPVNPRSLQADDVLDLAPASADLILHVMDLHWRNDPVGQLIQCRRALRPDGLLIAVFPGGETLTELRQALVRAELALTGGAHSRTAPMGDLRDMGGLLQRAGLALPVADLDRHTITFPDLTTLVRDLRGMGETSVLRDRPRQIPPRLLFPAAEAAYREAHATDDDRLPATLELLTLTGWAPHDSQQQPLRPGSATQSLAQALGVPETPAKD
ncbi:methyltransferase domain-containing protein [Pseudooceanicola aestuarii]|uniref:methyltransferase domain-containing protein n=1 Tax=Pseudooceanicola aestuarii TaxID=2697319 RepID=UPI0013D5A7BD|nr:methyltransferase domain-containing protein [Pseudooceanicola aestuarii]